MSLARIGLYLLGAMGIGVFFVGLELVLIWWRADRSDPYVTLSDRKMRLEVLTKKSGAK